MTQVDNDDSSKKAEEAARKAREEARRKEEAEKAKQAAEAAAKATELANKAPWALDPKNPQGGQDLVKLMDDVSKLPPEAQKQFFDQVASRNDVDMAVVERARSSGLDGAGACQALADAAFPPGSDRRQQLGEAVARQGNVFAPGMDPSVLESLAGDAISAIGAPREQASSSVAPRRMVDGFEAGQPDHGPFGVATPTALPAAAGPALTPEQAMQLARTGQPASGGDLSSTLGSEVIDNGVENCLEKAYELAGAGDSVALFGDSTDGVGHAVVVHGDGTVADPNAPGASYASLDDWNAANPRYQYAGTASEAQLDQVFALEPGSARNAKIGQLGLQSLAQLKVADPPTTATPVPLAGPAPQYNPLSGPYATGTPYPTATPPATPTPPSATPTPPPSVATPVVTGTPIPTTPPQTNPGMPGLVTPGPAPAPVAATTVPVATTPGAVSTTPPVTGTPTPGANGTFAPGSTTPVSIPEGPVSFMSPADQAEMGRLAHRLGEQGVSPAGIERAMADLRLNQIEREEKILSAIGPEQALQQAGMMDAGSQQALDHFAQYIDSSYSGLAQVDRAMAGNLAYGEVVEAKAATYEALALNVRAAELDLEQAVLQRQAAIASGQPAPVVAAIDDRIDAARVLLDGDPAATEQIAELQQRMTMVAVGIRNPNAQRVIGEIQDQIAGLRLQEQGLIGRLGDANTAYEAASANLVEAEQRLETSLRDYHAGIDATVPGAQAAIDEFRVETELATARPDLNAALETLRDSLPTASAEEIQAALDQIGTLPEGDVILYQLEGRILVNDPRMRLLSGREIGVPMGLERLGQELIVNTALLGLPSFMENQRLLNTPGISPELQGTAQFGLAMDYAGFALQLAGPVLKGVQTVIVGGRQVVQFSDDTVRALKAAGYTDELIHTMASELSAAATSSRQLTQMMLGSNPDDAVTLVKLMSQNIKHESYKYTEIMGHQAQQLLSRPDEVVDFLIHSKPEAVKQFWNMVHNGHSIPDAKTMTILSNHGVALETIEQAVRAGTLDDLASKTFFHAVDAQGAYTAAGLPRVFLPRADGTRATLDDLVALAKDKGYDILIRQCNPLLEDTMTRVPKTPVYFDWNGNHLKTSNIAMENVVFPDGSLKKVTFKTDEALAVVEMRAWNPATNKYEPTGLIPALEPGADPKWTMIEKAKMTELEAQGYKPMGGDIDILVVAKREADGTFSVVPGYGPEENALLNELNEKIAPLPAGLDEVLPPGPYDPAVRGFFMHGANYPYFESHYKFDASPLARQESWGPALWVSAEGKMNWLASPEAIEHWSKMRGVASEPWTQYSSLASTIVEMPVPSSAASYLAGVGFAGNIPEMNNAAQNMIDGGHGTAYAPGRPGEELRETPPTPAPTPGPIPVPAPTPEPVHN
jgi:hypothetical protein